MDLRKAERDPFLNNYFKKVNSAERFELPRQWRLQLQPKFVIVVKVIPHKL